MKPLPLVLPLLWLGVPAPADAEAPPLQLAADYAPHHNPADYLVSEKLDGVRAYWNGRQLVSRGGHAFSAPDWFVAGFPATPLDGELWLGRGRFAELSAAVRRFEPVEDEWREIRFMVFDLPASELPFAARVAALERLAGTLTTPYLQRVQHHALADAAALAARLDEVESEGGEGLMLRHRQSRYVPERNQDLLKLKRFQDAEARVLAQLPGQGRLEGMMGALLVETVDGRRFKLGTGFSDEQRRHPPAPGTLVTYRYRGETATGLPRFASFWRVRDETP
ncbi:DNA ligase [Oceanimonas sp. GK1]|uniref:DNA ligase n=1 Tax=Oceanimonas sp. (strain GK1 / IBRC-M 10197) TaxID=511062 RepID=UPI0002494FC0|nr:DNA ligase [Oceanimonas sp. GK1]AEY02205.1 DNA ligase [Oceanimonas sp. GK1]